MAKQKRVPIQEAADVLGISIWTIRDWRKYGTHADKLPIKLTVGRRLYVDADKLARFAKVYRTKN